MKNTIFALFSICLIFLTGCVFASDEDEQRTVKPTQIVETVKTEKVTELQNSANPVTEPMRLSQADIDSVCEGLFAYLYNCGDGSSILSFYISDDPYENAYIRYIPKRLPSGEYEFFRKLTPSIEISYDNGKAEIPLCINDTNDYRFMLSVDFSIAGGDASITGRTLTLLNDEDKEFSDMFSALDYDARDSYCAPLSAREDLSGEEIAELLRASAYNGNMEIFEEFYKLIPQDDTDKRHRIELAASMINDSGVEISPDNPYKSEIFYGESCKVFPQSKTLDIVAKSLQVRKSLPELGAELLEPNYDWASVYKIPNLEDYFELEYVREDEHVLGVYDFDLDRDGLREILICFPGGSIGNVFWIILHLDKAGLITNTNTGEGMWYFSLYRYNGDFFITSFIIDFNDKEFEGWRVYALGENERAFFADIYYEKIDAVTVFDKEFDRSGDYYYFADWMLYGYIEAYKRYEYEGIGIALTPDEETINQFGGDDYYGGVCGTLDFNNDGIDDLTNVFMFFPSNRYPYFCDYKFVDGATGRLLDFTKYFSAQTDLCRIFLYRHDDGPATKNYFVCLLGGHGNYVIKLIEIRGTEPIELHSWLVSVENRIMVKASEGESALWG